MKRISLHVLLCLCLIQTGLAQTDKEIVLETVQKNTIESHIYFLADDLLEGRQAGSRGNKIAASYLANQLKRYGAVTLPGMDSFYENFYLARTSQPEYLDIQLSETGYSEFIVFEMPSIDLSAEAIFIGYGTQSDFTENDIEGKVVVVNGGDGSKNGPLAMQSGGEEKKRMAIERGALGLIELVNLKERQLNSLKNYFGSKMKAADEASVARESDFFYAWVNLPKKKSLFEVSEIFSFQIQSDGVTRNYVRTQNLVGMIEGSVPSLKNEYVVYSAHYDHLGIRANKNTEDSIYNGARDNCIGVTSVLSMAENLGKYPTRRSAIFIFFTAEEMGLIGSSYFVEHSTIPLDQMVYCFNTDGGGYNNKDLVSIIGLERTTAQDHFEKAASAFGLEAAGDPAPKQNLFDRSDNVSFAKVGIPAPTYSTGFDDFDEEIMKYYHQPGDEASSLDYDYLLKYYQSYVYSARLLANDPEKPFWTKGDKYEEVGKKLYGLE